VIRLLRADGMPQTFSTASTLSGRPCLYLLFLSGSINILRRVAQV
jgi:hypothetical protein